MIKVGATALSEGEYDIRDYQVNNVLKDGNTDYPESFIRPITNPLMQGAIGMCTAMGTSHALMMQNIQEFGTGVTMDKFDLRKKMGHDPSNVKDSGDSMENAVKTAVKLGVQGGKDGAPYLFKADGYAYGKWTNVEYRISRFPLVVIFRGDGTIRSQMVKGEISDLSTKKRNQGHCVCLSGYDKDYYYFTNSWNPSSFKISKANFQIALKNLIINWRYFIIFDQKDAIVDYKSIELARQSIDVLTKLYQSADLETRKFLETVQVGAFLKKKYSL